jgi:hypothetical protein
MGLGCVYIYNLISLFLSAQLLLSDSFTPSEGVQAYRQAPGGSEIGAPEYSWFFGGPGGPTPFGLNRTRTPGPDPGIRGPPNFGHWPKTESDFQP